jgi:predicted negative regulator of RcsB-dependent stress response
MVVDTMPMRDPSIFYNLALLDLRRRAARTAPPAETAAVNLNLAVVLMRLANWDEALTTLGRVQLPEGAGVSVGTVAYLRGLCLEGAGRTTEAQAAFAAAANAGEARLSSEGPLIAPLARARLQAGR